MFYGNTMFIARKNRDIYLLRFIAVASGGYKTDFNLINIIATLCLLFVMVIGLSGVQFGL